MERNKVGIELFLRLFIILIAGIGTVWNHNNINIGLYIAFLLVYILNSQIRYNFLRERLAIISLFIDLGMIYFICSKFLGLSYVLLFVTMLDSLILLQAEGYIVVTIILGMLIYFIRFKGVEAIILNVAIYLIVFVFAIQIKKLRENIMRTVELYDENRKYSYQLEDTKKRLEDYMQKVEQVSQLEERNRISREIHDTLGHKLTGVIMQLDAAIRVSEVDMEKGKQLMASVRENMNTCIEILRQTVRNINPKGYTNRVLSIQQMLEDFERASGVDICFDINGAPVKLYPSIEMTLYKNAQEAVTNAVRHGKAKKINVDLEYAQNEVILTVRDNGKGCEEIVKGMGISGMEERSALVGGKLTFTSQDGFVIKTIIPIKGEK